MTLTDYNQPDSHGHFGRYSGVFVAETLIAPIAELQQAFLELANSVEAGAGPAQVSDAGQIGALTERLASL
ncbi:MAG TPA: hypothetical protein PKY22_09830, partial [Accumulibacter sp.]|nr:hypothetical protein [Accumulibacter sp.]